MEIVLILLEKIENYQIPADFGHSSPIIPQVNFSRDLQVKNISYR